MLAWLLLVGILPRLSVATLLSKPGTGTSVRNEDSEVETGVLPRSLSELILFSGVWTAR
jgi:hypothetical protein